MNACMYVCISMVLCSVSCLTLLFITMIVISHRFICDCVCSFLFYFIVYLVNIRIHIDYVCVFDAFFLLSLLFLFAILFCLYTVLDYVWVCNFTCLHLTFSVLFNYMLFLVINALFNCFVLWLPNLLLPLPPCFVFCLFAFSRRHFMLFSPLYATMIAIVILVFIILVFDQVRIVFKCL